MSEALPTILDMDAVVDLLEWRRSRVAEADDGVERLERAIHRLDELATARLEGGSPLQPWVETELLAIMGALGLDLFEEAAARANRLADRLVRPRRASRKR
jgi:hypothetical protein